MGVRLLRAACELQVHDGWVDLRSHCMHYGYRARVFLFVWSKSL